MEIRTKGKKGSSTYQKAAVTGKIVSKKNGNQKGERTAIFKMYKNKRACC